MRLRPLTSSCPCAACLPATSTFLGAVLSFDDAQRDGTVVSATGYAKFPVTGAGPVLDPELALLVIGESVVGGGPSYSSNFYVSPTFASDVSDQTYNPAGFPAWAVALSNYIIGLVGPPAGGGWGYKAVLKNSGVVAPAIAAAPTILPANNTFQFSFLLVAPLPVFNQGDVVKITGVKQGKGATPRLNGRWFVVSLVGQVLTLGRKYFPPFTSAASVNYIGGGNVNTTNYAIVPYTGVFRPKRGEAQSGWYAGFATWACEDPQLQRLIGPCGWGMDILRLSGLYRRRVRLFFNSQREDWIVWKPCAPNAPVLPFWHIFASGLWRDSLNRNPWSGPGEVKESWPQFRNKPGLPVSWCQNFLGTQQDFQNGWDVSILNQPLPPPVLDFGCTCFASPPVSGGRTVTTIWGIGFKAIAGSRRTVRTAWGPSVLWNTVAARKGTVATSWRFRWKLAPKPASKRTVWNIAVPPLRVIFRFARKQQPVMVIAQRATVRLPCLPSKKTMVSFHPRIVPPAFGRVNYQGGGIVSLVQGSVSVYQALVVGGGQVSVFETDKWIGLAQVLGGGQVSSSVASTWSGSPAILGGGLVSSVVASTWSGSVEVLGGGLVSSLVTSTWSGSPTILGGGLVSSVVASTWSGSVEVLGGGLVSSVVASTWSGSVEVLGGGLVSSVVTSTWSGSVEVLGGGLVSSVVTSTWSGSVELLGGGRLAMTVVSITPYTGKALGGGQVTNSSSNPGVRQVVTGSSDSASSFTVTWPVATKAGSLLVVLSASGSWDVGAPSGWTVVGLAALSGITSAGIAYRAGAPSETSVAFSLAGGSAGSVAWVALEVVGIKSSSPADKQVGHTGTSNPVASPATGVLGQAVEWVLGVAAIPQNGVNYSAPSNRVASSGPGGERCRHAWGFSGCVVDQCGCYH